MQAVLDLSTAGLCGALHYIFPTGPASAKRAVDRVHRLRSQAIGGGGAGANAPQAPHQPRVQWIERYTIYWGVCVLLSIILRCTPHRRLSPTPQWGKDSLNAIDRDISIGEI